MKVQELIEMLQKYPKDFDIIIQKDSEGNGYSPLVGAETAVYEAESTWSGQVLHPDDVEDQEENCVVLWPVN